MAQRLLEGEYENIVDMKPEASAEELRQLRAENRKLDEALRNVRNELGQAVSDKQNLERSIHALRNQLSPLHRYLRALFGEIELAVGEEQIPPAGTGNSAESNSVASADRWGAIKQRLTKKQAELIDVILLQGQMNRTQCAKAIKSDYTFCRKSVVAPLIAQGLLIEGVNGSLELKQL